MPSTGPVTSARPVLGPGGNRARSPVPPPEKRQPLAKPPSSDPAGRSNVGNTRRPGSSSASDSSGSLSPVRPRSLHPPATRRRASPASAVPVLPAIVGERKRCAWITPQSDPLHISFHDEEWGVPARDDKKLFELLVLAEAFGELSWPTILHNRDNFRKMFDGFDVVSVAQFTDKKLASLKECGCLLSEPKLRAVVENAKLIVKIMEEVGSFTNYCWNFVKHKPVVTAFKYPRQVPAKTPRADAMSKDMMRRGFRYVGPTIIYSFMQASGIVNDHLVGCFRHKECCSSGGQYELGTEKVDMLVKAVEEISL